MTQITQGSQIAQFGYDNANRTTSLTLPNNVLVEYAYDAASRVTSITYKQNGTTVIGDLTYKSILVDKDNYLLELCRYIVLNPVRAGMVKAPGEWRGSSYRVSVGASVAPKWLAVEKSLQTRDLSPRSR